MRGAARRPRQGTAGADGFVGVVFDRIGVGRPYGIQRDRGTRRGRQISDALPVFVDHSAARRRCPAAEGPAGQLISVFGKRLRLVVGIGGIVHCPRDASACAGRLVFVIPNGIGVGGPVGVQRGRRVEVAILHADAVLVVILCPLPVRPGIVPPEGITRQFRDGDQRKGVVIGAGRGKRAAAAALHIEGQGALFGHAGGRDLHIAFYVCASDRDPAGRAVIGVSGCRQRTCAHFDRDRSRQVVPLICAERRRIVLPVSRVGAAAQQQVFQL